MAERGYIDGTVCPVVPVPVGTGVLIAGGNYDSTDHNWIYDNWRYGTMQFWVPARAARRLRPDATERHLEPQPHVRQPHGHPPGRARRRTTAWTTGGTTRASATAGRTTTTPRGERTDNFTVHAALLRRRRLGLRAGRAGQGRRASSPAASTTAATRPGGTRPGCDLVRQPVAKPGPAPTGPQPGSAALVAAPLVDAGRRLLLALGLRRRRRSTVLRRAALLAALLSCSVGGGVAVARSTPDADRRRAAPR